MSVIGMYYNNGIGTSKFSQAIANPTIESYEYLVIDTHNT